MTRPRAVCHRVASIDGRVVVDGWPDNEETFRPPLTPVPEIPYLPARIKAMGFRL